MWLVKPYEFLHGRIPLYVARNIKWNTPFPTPYRALPLASRIQHPVSCMVMTVRPEVLPFIGATLLVGAGLMILCRVTGMPWAGTLLGCGAVTAILVGYFVFFFRDPERTVPGDPSLIVSGADGTIVRIIELDSDRFRELVASAGLKEGQLGAFPESDVVRISIFLSLFSVHVNRAPIAGKSQFLGYFPGKHFFTFGEKSSDHNQHNSILIRNDRTHCLVNQIVGPVCRRVVYWPDHDRDVDISKGQRIGMMKFGSRLDMYFPKDDIVVVVGEGDTVRAGETVIARLSM